MTKKRAIPFTLLYTLGVGALLGSLAFLPSVFRKKHFTFHLDGPTGAKPDRAFSLTRKFPLVIDGIVKGESDLATWMAAPATSRSSLLINFWATWCPPCVEELPSLEMLNRQLRNAQNPALPQMVTISVDESVPLIQNLFKTLDFKPSFPVLHDLNGVFAGSIGTTRFPETYLVGSDGRVLYKWVGPQNWVSEEFVRRLKTILARK